MSPHTHVSVNVWSHILGYDLFLVIPVYVFNTKIGSSTVQGCYSRKHRSMHDILHWGNHMLLLIRNVNPYLSVSLN